ncbi:hypothetical protein K2173_000386 [Erythroxylum novogranatense]|uniref:Leucine-rich repeat-containing N-terminal plant-type domain-containing protein n=1 Tax=Erythroxylum novogranatense TaxID=1862640 RepID=A0AAV8SW68_9ROSI|nr:hypothetical protein K2173_000386 [Erythroxylum novogranatense]
MRLQKEVITMIVLLLLSQWGSSHGCLEQERAALLQLQRSFNYPNGTSQLYIWKLNIDCCEWYGVTCDNTTGRVTELDLLGFRDESLGEWKFNASVFLPFQQLISLHLSYNNITCCVENEGFVGLQRLSNLEALYLDSNGLTNNILSMFQGFQSLKNLSLAYNKLSGSIYMKDLVNIPNLEVLDLSGNNIDKFVSFKDIQSSSNVSILWLREGVCNGSSFELQSLQAFKNLKSLHLEGNNFTGVLFPQAALNKLEELFLDSSDMDDNFFLSLGTLQSLRLLSLERMYYKTLNIQSLPHFKNLKHLNMSYVTVGNSFLKSIANSASLESLRLIDCGLTGYIDELCKLKNLQELDLGYNNINGTLPACLANLKNLHRLGLRHNNISGSLPPGLANLTLLQYLDVSFNRFFGNISASPLKSLISIEDLRIENNQFQIPMSLSPFLNHSKLKNLYADGNKVYAGSGGADHNLTPKFQLQYLSLLDSYGGEVSFPKFLHHQHDLTYLDLSGIQMRGDGFPSWLLDNNTNLERLVLSNCSLSGMLHLPFHTHPKLGFLDISSNLFGGQIPTEIGMYFPMLQRLYSDRNNFTGKIPDSLANSSLSYLNLGHNNLFGKIPEWIGNMSSLTILDLSNNSLFGSLPLMFIPPYVAHIYLSHNRLEGPFPDLLPNSNVAVLDLSHNCLTGGIPNSLKNLYGLRYVLLKHNKLEGEIPIYLWKMMNGLMFVDLSHNRFDTLSLKNETIKTHRDDGLVDFNELLELVEKGNTYQYDIIRMFITRFTGLDLSSNNLTCSIPSEIGNKEGTRMLNLSHNKLIGHIPLLFSNMTVMESLDLSYNNLNGTFPPQLVQLTFLEVFSVAYNNISGKTPERVGQFATFEESSYQGNPFLCGLPLPKNCTPTESSMTNESSTDDSDNGFIDLEIFQISFWVTFTIILMGIASVLYINPYWREARFYFIELMIKSCYYFLVDHLPFLSKFGITHLL